MAYARYYRDWTRMIYFCDETTPTNHVKILQKVLLISNMQKYLCYAAAIILVFNSLWWWAIACFALSFYSLINTYLQIDENGIYIEYCIGWKRLWKSFPEEKP